MTTDVIRLVQGDERPYIILTLTDDVTKAPIDLSVAGTTVYIRFRQAGVTTPPAVIPCTILTPATSGRAMFSFVGGFLDVPPGMYEGEIVIDYNGQTETVYEVLRFRIRESFGEPAPEVP